MSVVSKCRAIWDPIKRRDCFQKESDLLASKDTDVYDLNKYTNNIDKNSPLAKMSFQELLEYAKTHLGGKSKKRKINKKSKSKKLLRRKKITKRHNKLKKNKKNNSKKYKKQ
jgi:hypothetical protein